MQDSRPAMAPTRQRRSDAQRNRTGILEVAERIIARDGTQASLREIAREAGVGLGTLYRHFPTRDDLLQEVLRSGFDELAQTAARLTASHGPFEALQKWIDAFVEKTSARQDLTASFVARIRDPSSSLYASCAQMRQSAETLLGRAQAEGSIRTDLESTELLSLCASIAWLADQGELSPSQRRRLLTLMLEGLQGEPG